MTKVISALALLAVLAAASSSCSSQKKSDNNPDAEQIQVVEESLEVAADSLSDTLQVTVDEVVSNDLEEKR